jgi:hypothetical protein
MIILLGAWPSRDVLTLISSSFDLDTLSSSLAAYENDIFTRAGPSVRNSRQACLDAHDFSKIIEGSPLVAARELR